ncbi:MAG: hypothetical protein [Bacteriophage sp.]|nr:MAG: hypothetical protein [Bacteriophage sp.]
MATQLNLATLTAKDAYIVKIQKALETAVGQKIPIINIEKPKRISGVSASPVEFVFLGGQKLVLFVRSGADVFKATLNGKTIVLGGDFSNDLKMTFDNGVNSVAKYVRNGQKKFEASLSKERVKNPTKPSSSTPARSTLVKIKQVEADESIIDNQIAEKQKQVDELKDKIEQANQQRSQTQE